MKIKDKNILIIGIARSGLSAAKLCKSLGANVFLYDSKDESNFVKLIDQHKELGFHYHFGEFSVKILDAIDYMVLSPGVPTDLDFIEKARELGITVIGEIELAYRFCQSDILAITGTNGKTTTTSLVGEIIKLWNENTYVVGNIGIPFTDVVLKATKDALIVAEVSSFQLESIIDFHPKVAAILNFTPDHLNRHKTFENYVDIKSKIAANQNQSDFIVLNYDDPFCRSIAEHVSSKVIWFSMKNQVKGVYFKENELIWHLEGKKTIINTKDIKILGEHNIENVMAASAICLSIGVPIEMIQSGIKNFSGVEHRLEFVQTVNGVHYYNDSKATNPDAAIKGIQAMITPTVLIAGGMDKGNTFDEWIQHFGNKVKALILFGETSNKIEATAHKYQINQTYIVKDLKEAVEMATKVAESKDSVLLSPACASWDMFTSYEERGELFKKLVAIL